MPGIQDSVDLFFSNAGDFAVGPDGDLAGTESDALLSFKQECFNRVKSELQDWALHPWLGSGLSEVVGEANSRETAERGKELIENSLTMGAFINPNDVNIKYVPISNDALMYIVEVAVIPTDENDFEDTIKINLLFDFNNKQVVINSR